MKTQRSPRHTIGIVLFSLGLLLTVALTFIATWGDLEADFYDFVRMSQNRLPGLSCPILMAANEKPLISATVTNKTTYATNIAMRADFSAYGFLRSETQLVPFTPGETKIISWPISADDAIFRNFVLAKVYMGGAYPMPPAEASCGVYMLSLRGVSGMDLYWALFGVGLLSLVTGVVLLEAPDPGLVFVRTNMVQARRLLAVTAVLGLYLSYAGVWMFGVLAMVVILVLLFSLIPIFRQEIKGPI